ncbi:hypothetical protein SteCoe_27749 [Stentor coeruleus]|uniref:Uncharacterized protein n=1 Tax=Stentor coeruleus TaxID=5963 RepID=A0A1R2B9V3_9CILI|nr:hypothetical protein SteCoe_27749 [Stentor coeruleus]
MDRTIKLPLGIDNRRNSDLYCAQFKYKDLVEKLKIVQAELNTNNKIYSFTSFVEKNVTDKRNLRINSEKKNRNIKDSNIQDRKKDQSFSPNKRSNLQKNTCRQKSNISETIFGDNKINIYTTRLSKFSNVSVRKSN